MALAGGKKRFQFSLDEKTVEKLKILYSECQAPSNTLSLQIDEFLRAEVNQLEMMIKLAKRKGQREFSCADLERWELI